eukprot:7013676-Prymnesium_polylepis.1
MTVIVDIVGVASVGVVSPLNHLAAQRLTIYALALHTRANVERMKCHGGRPERRKASFQSESEAASVTIRPRWQEQGRAGHTISHVA